MSLGVQVRVQQDLLGGALIVKSKDPAASRKATGTLRKLLQGLDVKTGALSGAGSSGADGFSIDVGQLPAGIQVAAKDDKFVIAYGKDALADALDPSSTLGDSEPFKTAAGLLDGAKPSLFLDTPQVVKLASSVAGGTGSVSATNGALDSHAQAAFTLVVRVAPGGADGATIVDTGSI